MKSLVPLCAWAAGGSGRSLSTSCDSPQEPTVRGRVVGVEQAEKFRVQDSQQGLGLDHNRMRRPSPTPEPQRQTPHLFHEPDV